MSLQILSIKRRDGAEASGNEEREKRKGSRQRIEIGRKEKDIKGVSTRTPTRLRNPARAGNE